MNIKSNTIHLPKLEKIKIEHYSLYNNGGLLKYDFVNGINLIIGGNGTGKTTFINIIRYALIGLYKSTTEVKMYKATKKDKRKTYPYSYFKDRTDKSYENNQSAYVKLNFYIGNNELIVYRSLHTPQILKAYINKKKIEGAIITQEQYDKFQSNDERKKHLQYNYENTVAKLCGLSSFDDFITFIIDVLIFDERRKTVLWDSDFQDNIMLKYLTSPEDNLKYADLTREIKYNDSLSRHKSEEIKPLKRIIEEYSKESSSKTIRESNPDIAIIELTEEYDKLTNSINDIIHSLESNTKLLTSTNTNISINENEIQEKEIEIEKDRNNIHSSIWEKPHPKYDIFEKTITKNHICPMCNKEIEINKFQLKSNACFLCNQPLFTSQDIKPSEELKKELNSLTMKKNNLLKELSLTEKDISQKNVYLQELKNKKLEVQLAILKNENLSNTGKNKKETSLLIIERQRNKLIKERDFFAKIRNEKDKEREVLAQKIKQSRIEINKQLSDIFTSYAEEFIGLSSYLSFREDSDGNERYIPYIDKVPREDSEALSESQRFFIDHSFRMSVLEYFYTQSSFFICETPESSLDISYEKNAAKVFLKYLNHNNVLLLTLNLNNNAFIRHIVTEAKKKKKNINYMNLLELGKKSNVHRQDKVINTTFEEIRRLIDEK